ncbi:MAG: serine protease [Anaerolineae bacterium]|nr:serine protease [Anaerolineae bacterium]
MHHKFRTMKLLLFLFVAVSLACNGFMGGEEPVPETTETSGVATPVETEEVVTTVAPTSEAGNGDSGSAASSASNLRDAMQRVKEATIQIETGASMTDFDGTVYSQSGTGTGFIIDKSGIAVTNNHVVTGGRSWKVYVGGDTKALNAKVLGVSECSDLAVIQIEGSDDFPTLEWYEGEIFTGLPIYAAGFPLGDPEFTLTRGIVSKEEANGQTSWASVAGVIEHDATINPGNSGGPLVTEDGQVVAVNYANFDSQQQGHSILYYAIARDEARDIINRLREEEDYLAIGVNGRALLSDDGEFSGIWVQSVQSGSIADEARIEGGDIITSLEDRALATEGTMLEYCDTLRSHDADDTLNVEILRIADGQILKGQLNGRELEVTEEFDNSAFLGNSTSENILGPGSDDEYMVVTDNSKAFEVEIPASWTNINGTPVADSEGVEFAAALAAADTQSDDTGMQMMVFPLFPNFDPGSFLDSLYPSDLITECSPVQRSEYNEHNRFNGVLDFYEGCGPTNGTVLFLAVRSDNSQDVAIHLTGLNLSRSDMQHLFDTFELVGALP